MPLRLKPHLALLMAVALPCTVSAHSFGRLYNLPVPLWLYAWGAAAALLLSFLLIGWFLQASPAPQPAQGRALPAAFTRWVDASRPLARGLSLLLLLLAIASGLAGTGDAYRNFNMTWFWVVFVLGLTYATAAVGDVYAGINPWRTLADGFDRLIPGFNTGRWSYPPALAYWPALLLYFAFIWVELFARTTPHTLSLLLIVYSVITLLGVWAVGAQAWFRYGEFFAVLLRLVALMSPLYRVHNRVHCRLPFVGILQAEATHISQLLFVLFMLSSTAFDGLHATLPWFQVFWSEPLAWLRALAGTHPTEAYLRLRNIHLLWQSLCLLLSPFIYCLAYLLCLALAKRLTSSPLPLRTLTLRFAFTLLPIALVYHVTHYFTLLLTQGPVAIPLLSDPLGLGWNLFGGRTVAGAPILPNMAWVWHSQVGLILLGHVLSVGLAHTAALRLFNTRRQALLSQLPLLILMMAFTVAGLWILAQPLQLGG